MLEEQTKPKGQRTSVYVSTMLSLELAVKVISFLLPLFTACHQGMTWNMSTYFPATKTERNKIISSNCRKTTKQFQEHTGYLPVCSS